MFYSKNPNSYEDFIFSSRLWFESVCRNPLFLGEPEHRFDNFHFETIVVVEKHTCVVGLQIDEQNKHELYVIIKCSYGSSQTNEDGIKYYIRYVDIVPVDKAFGTYPEDCKWVHEDVTISDKLNNKIKKLIKAFSTIETLDKIPITNKGDLTQNYILKLNQARYNDGLHDHVIEWEDVPVVTPSYSKIKNATTNLIRVFKEIRENK